MMTTLTQILALIRKELLALLKEPSARVILVVPVLMQSLLFGYAASYELKHVPIAVLDQSHSEASVRLLADIEASGVFQRERTLTSTRQFADVIDDGHAMVVINIPPDFADNLAAGQPAPMQLILDARNSTTAGLAAADIASIVSRFNESLGVSSAIKVERRAWFNPNLESRWNLMPGLVATLAMIQTLLLAALSVAREREQGTFDQLLVTPLTPTQILIGKAIPPMLVGMTQGTLVLLVIRLWFEIPMNGSLLLLYAGLAVFTLAAVGIGLSISAVSLTMQQAMLYTFMLVMPLTLLSGLLTPVRNMPEVLQIATFANPLRFGMRIVRAVYMEGTGFADLWMEFIPLLATIFITLPIAGWLFRNRLS